MKRKKIIKKLEALGFTVRKEVCQVNGDEKFSFIKINGKYLTMVDDEGSERGELSIEDIEQAIKEQAK